MMFRTIIQAVLAVSVMQIFPANMTIVEQHATFPEAEVRVAGAQNHFMETVSNFPVANNVDKRPTKTDPTSIGVVTSAISALVIDRKTGQVLFEKNDTSSRPIGSIVKLMSALIFLESNPDLEASASLLVTDLRYGGRQYIKTNEGMTVGDLLKASLVGSDNSAISALARISGLSNSAFVTRMNERALELGMNQTIFVDETGLSYKNRSVATDVAILVNEAMKNDLIRQTTQLSQASFVGTSGREYIIPSTDELLESFLNKQPYSVIGGKTGFLPAAGYCFGAVISEHHDHELIVVILGSESKHSRFQDAKALAAWAYKVYEWPDERYSLSAEGV